MPNQVLQLCRCTRDANTTYIKRITNPGYGKTNSKLVKHRAPARREAEGSRTMNRPNDNTGGKQGILSPRFQVAASADFTRLQAQRRAGSDLQPADDADIVAVPDSAIPDGHPVGQRVIVGELDFLDDLAGVRIVLEKSVLVGVRAPQILAFPTDAMRTVAGGRKPLLNGPGPGVDAVDHSGRRHRNPELAFSPFETVSAGSWTGLGVVVHGCGLPAWWLLRCSSERTVATGGVRRHSVDHARTGCVVLRNRLATRHLGADDLPTVGRRQPDRFPVEGDTAGAVGLGVEVAQDLVFVVADEVGAAIILVDDPQSIFRCLQTVGLGTWGLEDGLHLADFAHRDLADRRGGRQKREELPAFNHVIRLVVTAPNIL